MDQLIDGWIDGWIECRFPDICAWDKMNLPAARNAVRNTLTRSPLHSRWFLNDPDCLLLRPTTKLTPAELQVGAHRHTVTVTATATVTVTVVTACSASPCARLLTFRWAEDLRVSLDRDR